MRVTTTKSKTDESFYINYAFINEKEKHLKTLLKNHTTSLTNFKSSVNFLNFLKN